LRKVVERILSNKIFLRNLRLELKSRQPENDVFHALVDKIDDRTLVKHYMVHGSLHNMTRQ
jgi:hypothetical protein